MKLMKRLFTILSLVFSLQFAVLPTFSVNLGSLTAGTEIILDLGGILGATPAMAGTDCNPQTGLDCGEHGSGPYLGGGYNPVMEMATVCLPPDIWKAVEAGGGRWDLNFAYPHVRKNERITTVRGQCVTRRMPVEYDTMAAAYIRCPPTYEGVVAVSVADARAAYLMYEGRAGAVMVRRPDMNE